MRIVIGLTGASGSIYAYSLIRLLNKKGVELSIVMTQMGEKVMNFECGIERREIAKYGTVYENSDLFAPIASGSYQVDGMVVVPCSMNTLGQVANGMGDTLLARSASVALKENKKLIMVVRETPYSLIALENMCKLANAGGMIMPASPGFYYKPTQIWELIDSITYRILDQLGVDAQEAVRWQEPLI